VSPCCSPYSGVAGAHFNEKIAQRDLESYRKKGPGPTARLLRDLLVKAGPIEGVLLDVGSGVGGLAFELLEHGVGRAIAVDASSSYLAAAAEEAARRGRAQSLLFVQGDFLDVASEVPAAATVTLDRVICCYPSYEPLLEESVRHAERLFAYAYPRDVWYVRTWVAVENLARQLRRNPFRTFVHSASAMEHVIRRGGFELVSRSCTRAWCADVYRHILTEGPFQGEWSDANTDDDDS